MILENRRGVMFRKANVSCRGWGVSLIYLGKHGYPGL